MIIVPGSADYWRLFEHTAYRLEVLQWYRGTDEDGPVRDFVAGRPQPALRERTSGPRGSRRRGQQGR